MTRRTTPEAGVLKRWAIQIEGWTPPRLNQLLGHHMVRHRRKKACAETVAVMARYVGVPKATGRRRVSLVITLGPRMRGGDPDSYWKAILDGLVAAGLLVDDSRTWLELGDVRYRRGQFKGTAIIIEDV